MAELRKDAHEFQGIDRVAAKVQGGSCRLVEIAGVVGQDGHRPSQVQASRIDFGGARSRRSSPAFVSCAATCRRSAPRRQPSGMVISQNIRRSGGGRTWWPRAAPGRSTGRCRIRFRDPRKALDRGSVADAFLEAPGWGDGERLEERARLNHSRTKRMSRSSRVREQFLLSVASNSSHCLLKPCYPCPAEALRAARKEVRGEVQAHRELVGMSPRRK